MPCRQQATVESIKKNNRLQLKRERLASSLAYVSSSGHVGVQRTGTGAIVARRSDVDVDPTPTGRWPKRICAGSSRAASAMCQARRLDRCCALQVRMSDGRCRTPSYTVQNGRIVHASFEVRSAEARWSLYDFTITTHVLYYFSANVQGRTPHS